MALQEKTYKIPSAMVICWIPHGVRLSHIRSSNFRRFFKEKSHWIRFIYRALFWTGNPKPETEIFASREAFLRYLDHREYRAASGLWNVIVESDGRSKPRVSFRGLSDKALAGFTPRPIPLPFGFTQLRSKDSYDPGEGRSEGPDPFLSDDQRFILFEYTVRFRLGEKKRAFVRKNTGYEPPWFWTRIYFILELSTRSVSVRLEGTAFPHHWSRYHINEGVSHEIHFHNMFDITYDDIRNSFEPAGDTAERGFEPTPPITVAVSPGN
jgi:hypothetical protein